MNIEVNDYVRTKNGVIDKVDALYGMIENTVHLENQKWFDTKNIVKHSKQLIDLIEVGDIINGHLVCEKYTDTDDYGVDFVSLIIEDSVVLNKSIKERDIQTILTKEQYLANCYKVGGEDE